MRADAFDAMVRAMCDEIPADFFDGVTEVTVSPRTVPHPAHEDVFTLGECIPLPLEGDGPDAVQSRVVLYHGSFRALAELAPGFDWREEAWQTLTHELRHHVEWRARRDELEALDRAAEANYSRQEAEAFDPLFHLDGDRVADGVYHVEDDWFLDRMVKRVPATMAVAWHGRRYLVTLPPEATLPAFITLDGVRVPPAGDLVLVLRRAGRVRDLFRPPVPWQGRASVTPIEAD